MQKLLDWRGGPEIMNTLFDSDDVQSPEPCTTCVVSAIEVPLDEAVVPEVTDQLVYLFGFDCYARWRGAAAISFRSLLS
jgi:hypothetical protein